MNIKRAKEEIEHTVKAYLAKDALGEYAIPAIRQRPILLMGPPGIGKTQVMEQVARECGVALVAYTITHHTRQSAVGPVSYTHLDVYKRQALMMLSMAFVTISMSAASAKRIVEVLDETTDLPPAKQPDTASRSSLPAASYSASLSRQVRMALH